MYDVKLKRPFVPLLGIVVAGRSNRWVTNCSLGASALLYTDVRSFVSRIRDTGLEQNVVYTKHLGCLMMAVANTSETRHPHVNTSLSYDELLKNNV